MQDFTELQKLAKLNTLPQTEEGVDLSLLTTVMRPLEEINEFDEIWEFQKLKSDVYEIVQYVIHH
jgi:intraflagellar transport protein 43